LLAGDKATKGFRVFPGSNAISFSSTGS
jgi:hypothetical protein